MTAAYSRAPGAIALGDAIEWGHPGNDGLALSLLGLPGAIGTAWVDLTRKTGGVVVQGGATWGPPQWGQSVITCPSGGTPIVQFAASNGVWNAAGPQTVAFWYRPHYAINDGLAHGLLSQGFTSAQMQIIKFSDNNFYIGVDGGARVFVAASTILTQNVWHRIVLSLSATAPNCSAYCNGSLFGTANGAIVWGDTNAAQLGKSNGEYGPHDFASFLRLLRPVDKGWVASDYVWSRDPQTDPRIRRPSTRSYFPTAAGVPTTAYLPAVACGWGW